MLSFLFKKAAGLIAPNQIIISLVLALSISGYLLVNSYKTNGKQSEAIKVLEQNNGALQLAHDNRVAEFEEIQLKMIRRQIQQDQVNFDTQFFRNRLAGVKNEGCIDFDLGDDFASVFSETSDSGEGLPVN